MLCLSSEICWSFSSMPRIFFFSIKHRALNRQRAPIATGAPVPEKSYKRCSFCPARPPVALTTPCTAPPIVAWCAAGPWPFSAAWSLFSSMPSFFSFRRIAPVGRHHTYKQKTCQCKRSGPRPLSPFDSATIAANTPQSREPGVEPFTID
jgi:hypothetical protein